MDCRIRAAEIAGADAPGGQVKLLDPWPPGAIVSMISDQNAAHVLCVGRPALIVDINILCHLNSEGAREPNIGAVRT